MADKKMPPELLAHFKKKQEEKEGDGAPKSDKEKRKDALNKAKSRLEEKHKKEG